MASAKVFLRNKPLKDGTFPIVIRIIKDRRASIVTLGYSVLEKDWDSDKQRVKKSHSNSARLNNLILKKLSEVSEKSLELEQNSPAVSSKTIQKALKLTGGTTFFKQAEIYCAELKRAGKFNRLSADQPRINRFKEFLNHADIAFQDITPDLLKRFKTYLMSTRTIKERTAINHLIVIRSVFSQAMSAGLVDAKYYPFGRDKIVVKFPDSIKIGLTTEEIKAIEELDLMSEPKMDHARNLFLLSFYFAGMRISDVLRLKWSDFQDGRLHYVMGKNLKGGSVKVPLKAQAIIDHYKDRDNNVHDLLFPDLEKLDNLINKLAVQQRIKVRVKENNEQLEKVVKLTGIKKKVTMHIARHSFGNISGDKIPVQMLQKLYRHSSITTTIGYQANFIYKDADDALDSVIGG